MSYKSPGYRNWLLCRSTYGKDDLVDAVLDGFVEPVALRDCKSLYDDKLMRAYVEASLLATEDFQDISDVLDIEVHALMLYHDLYYSVHDLPRLYKAQHLSKIDNSEERTLKQWAMTNGMDFIKWRLGLATTESMLDKVTSLQSDAYYRSKEAFFNSNSTTASSEGLKWSKQVVILTKLLSEMGGGESSDASDDLQLELSRITEHNIDLLSIEELI